MGGSARAAPRAGREEGAGIFTTVFGFLAFFVLLLFCVEVLFHLYATSMLTAAATDAAQAVADAGGHPSAEPAAQSAALAELGRWGKAHARFEWLQADSQWVRLRVVATSAAMLPLPGLDRRIERTVTIRTEAFRGAP